MGVALSALVGAVLGAVRPEDAGTVSGTASTVQQVGNVLGVALVGIVFFGLAHGGIATAFRGSLVYLAGTGAAVALVGMALPRTRR
jgi:hypothetical protein